MLIKSRNVLSEINTKVPPLSSCLAKTLTLPDNTIAAGIDVPGHCIIVGEVAKELVKYSTPAIRDRLFPPGSELVAASHDVGKVWPAFQEKIRRAVLGYQANSLPGLESADPDLKNIKGGHAAVSQAALENYGNYIPKIAGRHHGYSVNPEFSAAAGPIGGAPWQRLREELLEKLQSYFVSPWPRVTDNTQAAVLSGLTAVADWIGSGPAFDGIQHIEDIDDLPERVKRAVAAAGFVRSVMRRGLSFKDVFGKEPRPVQSQFIPSASSPGVYVLEAPMGIGKTEAALYAAYQLFCAGAASGIYFALPTRLTSDKIYQRMNDFLETVLDDDSPLRKSLRLHSSAWLYEMGEEGEPGASWFQTKKRGLLAPFAVGTIDQALMAVMNVKHGFVRAFGLAGKVVILDEVHSYDSYTGTLIDELVRGLRETGATVIILSATLTNERRRSLLDIPKKSSVELPELPPSIPAYPLISFTNEKGFGEIPAEAADSMEVSIRRVPDDQEAVEEALKRAEEGQQVLWIENTVDEAQDRYVRLAARAAACGIETGLLHSRFTQNDRSDNEDYWVGLYGKEAGDRRGKRGRILAGTQVLEQSLDIDADFLVSRLCPTDMLLQRIGRLWRHRAHDPARPAGARAETWILSADYKKALANHKEALGKTAFVYSPYVLLRTLEVWENKTSLSLPQDIRPLVEATYAERDETGLPGKLKQELVREREKSRLLALQGISGAGITQSESKAETRYSDRETQEVLLLKRADRQKNGDLFLVLSNGKSLELPKGLKHRDKSQWRKKAAELSRHIVSVPKEKAPSAAPKTAEWFEEYIYTGRKKEHGIAGTEEENMLRIALIRESNELAGIDGGTVLKDYSVSYDNITGYRAEKRASAQEDTR
jgi:CRISPR-associated endonuclease/helicase Cas3